MPTESAALFVLFALVFTFVFRRSSRPPLPPGPPGYPLIGNIFGEDPSLVTGIDSHCVKWISDSPDMFDFKAFATHRTLWGMSAR